MFSGGYGYEAYAQLDAFFAKFMDLKGLRGLVIGSESPWIELLMLEHRAEEVITVDYKGIISEHEKIKTMSQKEMNERFLNNTLPQFDVMVSFSSLEHSGLGRYY